MHDNCPYRASFTGWSSVSGVEGRPTGRAGQLPGMTNQALRNALEVTGGRAKKLYRVNGSHTHRIVTIAPDGTDAVTVALAPRAACDMTGAVCTEDGRALSTPIATRIAGPTTETQVVAPPFTAAFANVPAEHDGSTPFTVEIEFSESPHGTGGQLPGMKNVTLRNILRGTVSGGTVKSVYRVTIDPDDSGRAHERYRTDIDMRMGAVGARGDVLAPANPGEFRLRLKSDAVWVRTSSDAVRTDTGNLAGAEADVTRTRLLIEGSRSFCALTPSAEVGVRYDGGDAETGAGLEAGAGLAYTSGALTIEARARMLVAHEESGYEEWGASGSVRLAPNASGRGLSLSITPSWDASASGTGQLWSMTNPRGIAGDNELEADRKLEAEIGYGLGLQRAPGVLTPFAALTLGDARTWRAGARWHLAPEVALGLEAGASSAREGEADRSLMLRAQARF